MEANDALLRTSAARKRVIRLTALLTRIWVILGVVLLLMIVLEISLTSYYQRADKKEIQSAVKAASSGAYANADLAEEYFKELIDAGDRRLPWAPYTQSREPNYTGKFINVNEGTRRTWNSEAINDDKSTRLKIFFFGGSTLWGVGSRDDFTIPSLVAKMLAENGISAKVTNYAVIGDVTTQSLIRFVLELRKRNAPDLVVFYGGRVDASSACYEGKPGVPFGSSNLERISSEKEAKARINIKLENLALIRLLIGKKQHVGCSKQLDVLSDGALDVYLGNVRFIEAISRSLSFKALFYLEPQLADKIQRTKYEEDQLLKSEKRVPGKSDLYSLMRSKLVKRQYESLGRNLIHDLRTIFSDVASPIYINAGHYGEDGNERISRKIAADILALCAPAK
ncbi:SGNH/GDSL hydrolase family protein [Bradyrhizobium cenepequi]|uniref:SGNH/GDSL hydrolase family protein n=1 Tax=Bradyrhizobium cenepequi TaxID=2821403 RepID=UPI001CE31A8C|nr:SGNH/GDSL hydrolase family protein [Bradyrhizobium cenepequi]MCA6111269.1 SGNH/GDSL hydrolase family protein [Bradyrhizobium cenepequi]